ncbi:putative ribosome biogenesis protein urb1 protein [Coleophoma cylindrospora]|uniref:Putative ribosome biogenesis protein urb1 protein n=1 Tax=Coleophoma cylindrospora TaxID=1849047 RepID=A0A3D8R6Y9_9HELO|nr:putative ribosome biogenesis protein urb1 protein [Coleophoma cylindrospora]
MVKRSVDSVEDGAQAYQKRQKISINAPYTETEVQPVDQVKSGRQLRQILTFDQDAGRAKRAIDTFKTFLDSLPTQATENPQLVSILKDYLESQKPANEEDKDHVYLSDIMQTWNYAAQSNNESLSAAVSAVLANLLKTISNFLEFSEYGLRLGRTLLQKPQQELIARGLSAQKSKEHVISPALRLVREMTIFDGGSMSKQVFRARDRLLKSLARNLLIRLTGDAIEDRRRPSVRTNSLRLTLALIKFLPSDAKRELLNQRDIVSALTRDIKDDPPFMVLEVLETLKAYVLKDEALPRDAKTKVVNALSLGRFTTLYRYDQVNEDTETGKKSVEEVAHEFLILACTSPDLGLLNRQSGFYPRGIDPDDGYDANAGQAYIDLGLDSIEWMDRFTDKVPVRNTILSDVIQNLKPWSSTKQSELLLAILQAAPELVADYFFNKKSFSFDPKLTTTWVGYSAFLYSTIQLPIPTFFGHAKGFARLPPPTSIVLESILPQPLNQKSLTRCLNQSVKLITFFAIRILVIAFKKLQAVLKMYREAAVSSSSVWNQAADALIAEFCLRCPIFEDIVKAYRSMTDTDLMQRQATSKLLVLYYEVIPRVALVAKFDVSGNLTRTLQAIEDNSLSYENRAMLSLELENLFEFAHFSPGMRWFARVDGLALSPFMAMLKLSAYAPEEMPLQKLRSVLGSVVAENQILQTRTQVSALDCLTATLRSTRELPTNDSVNQFLDSCVTRCASTPIKYIYALEKIQAEESRAQEESITSLLTMVFLEQWPFLVKTAEEIVLKDVADFLARYLALSVKLGEDKKVIKAVGNKLAEETPEGSSSRKVIGRYRKLVDDLILPTTYSEGNTEVLNTKVDVDDSENDKLEIMSSMLEGSETPSEDHSALVKWTNKEVEEVFEGGYAAALVMLLSSTHLSVRKEAATNISKLASKTKESTYEGKEQMWLLLCEVVETARKVIDDAPLTTILSSFASHAISVLADPLHCLYPKVNKFLSQGPIWELQKPPLMFKILDDAPSLDDAHYTEIDWLLTYMLAGLRNKADLAIFHKRRVFEKMLSLYNNAYLAAGLRDKILRILFRATTIEGGSTTLITRFSSITWADAQIALGGGKSLKVLMDLIVESSDKARVENWKKGIKNSQNTAA